MNQCPLCLSPFATLLGQLGARVHLRCRQCGSDRSVPVSEFPELADAEYEVDA